MPTPTDASGFAMNYSGRGDISVSSIKAQVDKDLAELWDMGFRKLRTGLPPFDYSQLAVTHSFVQYVIAAGFEVMHGVTATNGSLNANGNTNVIYGSSRYNAYLTAVAVEAAWAQANGVQIFTTGNEEGGHIDTSTAAQTAVGTDANGIRSLVRADQRALAAACASAFTRGPITVSISQGESGGWITDQPTYNRGGYTALSFNTYDTINNFRSHVLADIAAFGVNNCWITELNNDDGYKNAIYNLESAYNLIGREEEKFSVDQVRRLEFARDIGIPRFYYFAFQQFEYSYAVESVTTGSHRMALDDMVARLHGRKPRYAL